MRVMLLVQAARVSRTVAHDRLFRHTRRHFMSNAAAEATRTSHSDCDDSNDSLYALEEDNSKSNFDKYNYDDDNWLSDVSDHNSSSCQTNFLNNNNPMDFNRDDVMHVDDEEDMTLTVKAMNEEIINKASLRVSGVPFLLPFQMMAVLKILFDVCCNKKNTPC